MVQNETKQPAETHDKTILNSTTVTTKQIQGSTSVSSKDDRKDRTRTSGSDSSVAEDLPLHDQPHMNSDSIMEKMIQCPSRTSPPYDKKHEAQNVTDVYSESFESVDNSMNSNPSAENMSKHGRKSEDVTGRHRSLGIVIRSPLVPRSHRRHDSSGSEDSLTISQSETASDQSDIEGRIFALKEELRHRRLEAERLKKEQKQIYRERLKEREESLKKQIEAYDKFIQKTQQDLDVELEASVLSGSSLTPLQIKPQIKQPRVAESRRLCKQLKLDKSQSSGEVSPVKLSVELTAVDDSKELRISKSEQELSYSRDEQKSTDSISSWSKSHQDNTGTVQSHFKDKQDGSGHTYGHEVKKTLGFEDEHKYKDVTSLNSSDEQEFSMCKEDSVVSELYVSKCKNTDSRSYSNKGDEGPSTSKDQFVLSETEEEVKETVPLCEVKFDKLVLSKLKGASVSRPEEQIGKLQHSESGSVSEITGSVPPGSTYQNRSSESESRSVPEITESVPPGSTYQNRSSESQSRSVPEITGSVPSGSTYKGRNSELGSRSVNEITELVPSGTTYENRSSESESGSMPEITGSVHSDCIAKNRISESEYSEYKRVPDSTESVHSSSSAEEKSKDSNHSGPRHISEVTESVPSGSSAKNSISESKHSRAKSVPKVTESVPIDARALKIELNCPDLKASQATKHLPTELTSVQEVPGAENPEALVLKFADKKLVATEKEQDEGEQSLEETSGPGGNDSVSSISVISVGPSLQTGQGSSGEDSTQKRLYINLDNCSEFKKKSTESNKSISVSLNHICTEEETVVRSESGSCVSVKQEPEAGISHEELVSSLRHEENREDGGTTLKPVSLRQSEVDLENCHVEENKCELPQVATNEEQGQVPYQTHQQQQLAESITTKLLITFIDDAVNVVHRIAAQQQHRQTETKRQHGVEAPRQVTGEDTIHEVKPKKEQRINGEQLERISHMLSNVLLEDALHTVIQIYCRPTVMVRCTHPRGESQTVSDQNVVSKKVNSILATLDCPRSPKERYRPQDLMVLSVVPDDIEDVQLGPVLNTFHTELFDEQEWFEDDLGLSSKERQDDQLLLQQQFLLEQYQQYFYQQIPNKPPPPYTPPQSTAPRSKVDLQRAAQPKAFSIVPQSYEEVKEITDKAANDVFEKLVLGHSLSDIHSNDQFEEEQNVEEITQLSQQSFETFIFSLVKEITADLYNIGKEEILPVWVRKRQLTPKPLLPSNARQFTTTVENCVAQKLGLNSCNKSTISSRCGFKKLVRKKTDFVDTILIQELREEEQEWVSYDEDEVTVKVQIASAIFNLLLEDTIHLAKRLFERTSHFLER
ncbi:uncharacterized protein LOC143245407 isoform X2 [Tachypleus tridentatus]|uniref:uncharacterized protein LOC143245407 isoform X2 n=1 Tax=Tachypleus tridentatus TaxID=6853 RepID=UPI003FCF2DEF